MANLFLFKNLAITTLAAPITSTATSITLATGTGSLFPEPAPGQQFAVDLNDAATGNIHEIVYCTSRTGDVLTILRAQDGTVALPWLAGDYAANKVTAGALSSFVQGASSSNFAVDTGTANALVVTLPIPISGISQLAGVPLYIQKSSVANSSGTVTLAANGTAALNITHADGSPLGFFPIPELPANGVFTVVLNSSETQYHLQSVTTQPATLSEFTSSLTSSGWMKRPDGIIEQWGSGTTTSGSGTVVFPIAFPTAVLASSGIVGITGRSAQSSNESIYFDNTTISTTGMNVYSTTGTTVGFTYRVLGY